MKPAVLGGSFNPVHVGHLFLAESVLSGLGYDRIILVPAYASPFKPDARMVSPEDRLEMLAASIPADPRITIDDCEIRREGISYTADTLKDLINRYQPEGKPGLILGDDLAADFLKWKRSGDILEMADIIIARRISSEPAAVSYPHRLLKNDIINISSGMVRERIKDQENWRYLVPAGARFIIEDRRLYGFTPQAGVSEKSPDWETVARIEAEVRLRVGPLRFSHSRNTALLAWDLCRRFGLDPIKGYLAGISHDICKSLSEEELFALVRSDGQQISALERKKPSLLHARAAAVLLQERFGIHNKEILDAVRLHTVADVEMGPLAKVVYISDKIEISREHIDPSLRNLSRKAGLDQLFEAVLDDTVAYLRSRKLDLSEGTLRLFEVIHKKKPL
ncbi:MAG: nicotinate (nicotinamide) nucleotide adenylyltransferase [Treponema sp.]|nr:nicotinate (nicotinamide) nucleotide adenylyltransferase [Treponema sp.]